MAVPPFQELTLPLLKLLSEGQLYTLSDAREEIAARLHLTEADKSKRLPSGKHGLYASRFYWASVYLRRAALIEQTPERYLRITQVGQDALRQNPTKIDLKFLSQYPELNEFLYGRSSTNGGAQDYLSGTGDQPTPEEALDASFHQLERALAEELIERVRTCSSHFFVQLVIDLLLAMGYGGSRAAVSHAFTLIGEDSIGGVIQQDKFGLDAVYIQAMRGNIRVVGRRDVQAFALNLENQNAQKGILMTTARISTEAEDYVRHGKPQIVLIGGNQLAQLMIDHGIGVCDKSVYTVKKLDEDYFSGT